MKEHAMRYFIRNAPRAYRAKTGIIMAMLVLLGVLATPASARTIRLVALGDSLSAGYLLAAKDAFPAVLESALRARGHDIRIENAGVSGDTTTGGLDRLDWSVPEGTDGVILELGANDALRGIAPEIAAKALDEIITRLKARGIGVFLAGMHAPRNNGVAYIEAFDAIYPELAKRHAIPLYPFFLDGVQGNAALNLADMLHPNPAGVRLIVERMLPQVEDFMKALAKP